MVLFTFCCSRTSVDSFTTLPLTHSPIHITRMTKSDGDPVPGSLPADGKFHFAIDRGGTFTDVHCRLPDGTEVVRKLLSEDPAHYKDAPTEGIRRILDEFSTSQKYPRGQLVATAEIGSIRMGTTVATNALLERDGEPLAFITTKGFADLLQIGNQARPNIFDLTCAKPSLLHSRVLEIDERIALSKFAPDEWRSKYPTQKSITEEDVLILKTPNLQTIRPQLEELKKQGITALAISLMHAYVYPEHELAIGKLAEEVGGFTQISLSHKVMPMVSFALLACFFSMINEVFVLIFVSAALSNTGQVGLSKSHN